MRSEKEMMDLIINTAASDDRVLAAYMKGSRTNPEAPEDRYRDFDIVYVVKETAGFIENPEWLDAFGKIVLKQEQKDLYGYGERFGIQKDYDRSYSWLLIFDDGNRIDIGVEIPQVTAAGTSRNRLFLPLLDKCGCLPELPPPSDVEFHIKKPSAEQFDGCCTEFFWCMCDVVKGIARDELPFAMTTYNVNVRSMLETMLSWYIGILTGFSVSSGKLNKYLKRYLPADFYSEYTETYSGSDYHDFWHAIDTSFDLFRRAALEVSAHSGFNYPDDKESAARGHIKRIRKDIDASVSGKQL